MTQVAHPRPSRREKRPASGWLTVVLFVLVGTALRLVSINTRGLWLDEAITASQTILPLRAIFDSLVGGVHPPLYHVLMHVWISLFGSGEVALRSFSLVAGVAAIPAAFWAGKNLYDRRTGLIAAALVAFSPFQIWYSQEARMYELLFLASLLSTAYLALACRDNRRGDWVGYGAWTLVALFTHYFSLFLIAGQVVYYLFWELVPQERRLRREGRATASLRRPLGLFTDVPTFGSWLACAAVAASLLAIWVLQSVVAPGVNSALISSVSGSGLGYGHEGAKFALRFNDIAAVFTQMAMGFHAQDTMDRLVALWPLLLYVMFLLMYLVKPVSSATRVLIAGAAGMFAMLLVGQWQQQMLVSRYFMAIGGPIYLLVARTIAKLDRRAATPLLVGLAVLAGAAWADQSYNPLNSMRYDNREAFQTIREDYRAGDVILYEPSYIGFLATYYLPPSIRSWGVPVALPGSGYRNKPAQLNEDLGRIVHASPRVWVVLSFQDIPAVRSDAYAVESWLVGQGRYRLAHNGVLNKVQLLRYDSADQPFFLPGVGQGTAEPASSEETTSGAGGTP